MNVKISVKKLFNMEQIIAALKDGQQRYRDQIGQMFNEHEDLKEKLTEAGCSLKRMDERIQAYQKEADEYKRDIEILSHQLKHTRQLNEVCNNHFVESHKKCKALDEQNDALKQEIEDLKKDRNDWEDAARSAADNL